MHVKLSNICKNYTYGNREHKILSNICMEINSSDRIWISGKNGSGKSTLLKIIAGEILADSGEIVYSPKNISISLLAQSISDYIGKNLTIIEHIALGLMKRRLYKRLISPELESTVFDTLRKLNLGLENRLYDFVGDLSGGEAQIIGILTVLHTNPDLICFDEPSASLDFRISSIICNILKEYTINNQTAIIFASHDLDFVRSLLTKEICLE